MRSQPSDLSNICRDLGLNDLPPLEAGPEAMASGPRALAETDLCWLTPSSASQPTSSAETAVPGAGLRRPALAAQSSASLSSRSLSPTPSRVASPQAEGEVTSSRPRLGVGLSGRKTHLRILAQLRAKFSGLEKTEVPAWRLNLNAEALAAKNLSAWGMVQYFYPQLAKAYLQPSQRRSLGSGVSPAQYRRELREVINLAQAFHKKAKPIPLSVQYKAAAVLPTAGLAIFLGTTMYQARQLQEGLRYR